MKSKFLFDHVYKTAGSSVERVFVDHFGQEEVTFGLIEPLALALSRHSDKTVITGHFSIMPGERLPRDRYTLTLLRHPVDRMLSHYFFSRNQVPKRGGNAAVELAKKLSLDAYVSCDAPEVRALLQNDQTMHFFPICWDGFSDLSPEGKLAAAKAALDRFDLVGAYEEFDDFVHVLTCDAGIPPVSEVPRANATRGRAAVGEIDAGIRRWLEDINALDIALYEHALTLFRAKRRELLRRSAVRAAVPVASGDAERISSIELETPKRVELEPKPSEAPSIPVTEFGNRRIELLSAAVRGVISYDYRVFAGEVVTVRLTVRAHERAADVVVGIRVTDAAGRIVFGSNCRTQGRTLEIGSPGDFQVDFRFRCDLGYGDYSISTAIHRPSQSLGEYYHWREQAAWLSVIGNIGDHWEGAMKLYPQISCSPVDPSSANAVALVGIGDARNASQHLCDHAPILSEFQGLVEPVGKFEPLRADEVRAIEMTVHNNGPQTWPSTGLQRVCVSYRWRDGSRNIIVYDGERTPLPRDIDPGESLSLWVVVKAPSAAGTFTLSMTLIQEYHAWFDEMGAPPSERVMQVLAREPATPSQ